MDSNQITKAKPLNPMSKATYPEDSGNGGAMARRGYEVLDSESVRSRREFPLDRPERLSEPVYITPRVYDDY